MSDSHHVPDDERASEIARLRSGMMMREFFLMRRIAVAPEKEKDVMLEHLRWVVDREKRGEIFLTGPIWGADGRPRQGMTILRASDFQQAEAIARTDPFVVCGAVDIEIDRWLLGGGRVTVSIDLSDQSVRLD